MPGNAAQRRYGELPVDDRRSPDEGGVLHRREHAAVEDLVIDHEGFIITPQAGTIFHNDEGVTFTPIDAATGYPPPGMETVSFGTNDPLQVVIDGDGNPMSANSQWFDITSQALTEKRDLAVDRVRRPEPRQVRGRDRGDGVRDWTTPTRCRCFSRS